jgi:hypothetical protein
MGHINDKRAYFDQQKYSVIWVQSFSVSDIIDVSRGVTTVTYQKPDEQPYKINIEIKNGGLKRAAVSAGADNTPLDVLHNEISRESSWSAWKNMSAVDAKLLSAKPSNSSSAHTYAGIEYAKNNAVFDRLFEVLKKIAAYNKQHTN